MRSLTEILKSARDQHNLIENQKINNLATLEDYFGIEHKNKQKGIYLVISLSCPHCIEIIPELVAFNNLGIFNLITDGDPEDNSEIKNEFNYDFNVYSYQKSLEKVNITQTPTSLLVNESGEIVNREFTPDISSIMKFCNLGV